MDLRGKAVLVTGGAVRLGRAIALGLAGRGADVAITYHQSAAAAEETAATIRGLGRRTLAARCDQRCEEQVRGAVAALAHEWGRLDVLVNSAAVFRRHPFEALTAADWDDELATNLRGPFLFSLAAASTLRAEGGGKIVNIADIAGIRPWADYLPYSVSKAGLIALTQGLAKALAPDVQVNAVAPGAVLWPGDFSEEQRAALLEKIPLRRAGTPEDVVNTVLYLVEGTDYVTGQVLSVDGGRLLR
jgi:pteridine reductase